MAETTPGLRASLHLPRTDAQGQFVGESGQGGETLDFVVLDDGQVQALRPELTLGAPSVDHDARTLRQRRLREVQAAELAPAAVALAHSEERRQASSWSYAPGHEVDVEPRDGGVNQRQYVDLVRPYDAPPTEAGVRTDTQTVTVYDFRWQFALARIWGADPPDGEYLGEARTLSAEAYRTLRIDVYNGLSTVHQERMYVQGLVRNVRLAGNLDVGWIDTSARFSLEVVTVLRREHDLNPDGSEAENVRATWVDVWLDLATRSEDEFGSRPEDATPVDVGGQVRYIRRHAPGEAVGLLRDTVLGEWAAAPLLSSTRFTAAGGALRVEGPPSFAPQTLEDATLSAFGHTFVGGTWAALRDAPRRREDGTLDWDTVLVLHASADTVSAVRQDGRVLAYPRSVFEAEVLRVGPGAFQGFSPVGLLSNTWPPHWAWARCGTESRALVVHDAWRDSYRKGAPQGSPKHWSWSGRPAKRPKVLPLTAPAAPLGLTLADVSGMLLHDEPLRRGEGPLLLPLEATVGGRDVRAAVAKRVLYPPAQWPEELDDRSSTPGPLTLTYDLPLRAQADDGGATGAPQAALLLRLKLTAPTSTLTVNGEARPLYRLGHNAAADRGWHPYVVPVPVTDTYVLTYAGRCSRALLCVRDLPTQGAS